MTFETNATANELLNELLIRLHRSLVQYVLDAWLWSTPEAVPLKGALLTLLERQREDVGLLANLLTQRRHAIDFGTYPMEFTRVNYLAVEFLFSKLCDHQHSLVKSFEQAVGNLDDDPQGKEIVQVIAKSQKKGLDQLWNVDLPGSGSETVWMK